MFDTLDLLSTTKDFSGNPRGGDPDGLLRSFNGVIASSAASGVTLAPAAVALLQIGEQLTQQDGETSGGKKKGNKKQKAKNNKSNLADDVIKGFYFNLVLLFRLFIEEQRKNGRVRTIRAKQYFEVYGLTGILVVNFMDQAGTRYTYNSENQRILTTGLNRIRGLVEVVKPDGTVVYLFGR